MPTMEEDYRAAVQLAASEAVSAEPEAQLTTPVAVLLTRLCAEQELGELSLIREAHLDGVRPDFAALIDRHPCGWIELKAPSHSVDGPTWTGREKRQWSLLAALDSLIVTNGAAVRLYRNGETSMEAQLPFRTDEPWNPDSLVTLLRAFLAARPATVTRVSDLAARLAPLTAMLRDKVAAVLTEPAAEASPAHDALEAWRVAVDQDATERRFADDLAQVVAYSLAIAGLHGGADLDGDGFLSLGEARTALEGPNSTLAATLGPVVGTPGLVEILAPEIGAIERLVSQLDINKIQRSTDSRGEPWLWFYEDFLASYDPEARKSAGVYFTPVDVVECQVRLTEHILRTHLGKNRGFADPAVTTLDPAAGSGTYPLAVINQAIATAQQVLGAGGGELAAKQLEKNLIAFEMLPGPYAVTSMRIGTLLAEHRGAILSSPHVRAYLTDTLEDPEAGIIVPQGLWGDSRTLAVARAQAAEVKQSEPITVVIGNPPYGRTAGRESGGWVLHGGEGDPRPPLFEDVIQPAKDAQVIFSAQASLYDSYVYFWRWAMWKAMQQSPRRAAVVSFITSSTWIRGAAFVGLRSMARTLGDEVWVVDLGGDGRATGSDDNVFAIQTPVAIVTIFRAGPSKKNKPASVYYQRLTGSRAQKLAALRDVKTPDQAPDQWTQTPENGGLGSSLVPDTSSDMWSEMPTLDRIFPWRQPGAMFNRAWPIAPSRSLLEQRWTELLATGDNAERAERFVTAATGRSIYTKVAGLPPLAELTTGAAHRPLVRYGYRSFDRQWTFADARLAKTESPALWSARSDRQLFLTSMMTTPLGEGPALTLATAPPDKHHFRGSYGGKDVVPLYRDGDSHLPNLTAGLLDRLSDHYDAPVTPEQVAAYTYAVLAHPGFAATFSADLQTSPAPRVPLTADAVLFARAVATGERLLWLHSFGTRYTSTQRPPGPIQRHPAIGWKRAVQTIPATVDDVTLDSAVDELRVGDGLISGVRNDVWTFQVSGFQPVRQWFGQRTRKGVGRAATTRASHLDLIRPTEWDDEWNTEALELLTVITHTLDGYTDQVELLGDILAGPLLRIDQLPDPTPQEAAPPKPTEPWYL